MSERIPTPVVIYVVHHPECKAAAQLARQMYAWFRLSDFGGDAATAGLPVYYRRALVKPTPASLSTITPEIEWDDAQLNVVILLVDQRLVGDLEWRAAVDTLTQEAKDRRFRKRHRALLLPVALHESFYRLSTLYADFNPIRLLQMTEDEQEVTLRRSATEATTRTLRTMTLSPEDSAPLDVQPPPLDVFLSHAKRDGIEIAECLRDSVRSFGQLVAWYDANDLPIGYDWNSPIRDAARQDTAAMVAVLTDAYPTRPWCRFEAALARTPRLVGTHTNIWWVQPVVAVTQAQSRWVRGVPMLTGVPHMGWNRETGAPNTAQVVDRIVLEMLLFQTHSRLAQALHKANPDEPGRCYITWVPDSWSLIALRQEIIAKHGNDAPGKVEEIVYPGYGLRTIEEKELATALHTFSTNTILKTYEDAWEWDPDEQEPDTAGGMTSSPLVVALSAGGRDSELAQHGLGMEHINEVMVRLARKLLKDGRRLAFGGTLGSPSSPKTPRSKGDTLTQLLIDAALGWQDGGMAQQVSVTAPKTWPLVNYSAWPFYSWIEKDQKASWVGVCEFWEINPKNVSQADLVRLVNYWATDSTARRHTADALTEMRRMSAHKTHVRIVWCGRERGSIGWMPGIAEEVLCSLQAEKPVLILGGFGGCAHILADFLGTPEAPWPETLMLKAVLSSEEYARMVTSKGHRRKLATRFNALKTCLTELRQKVHAGDSVLGIPNDVFKQALTESSPRKAIQLAQEAVRTIGTRTLVNVGSQAPISEDT